ncbi:hypothetical protein SBF1_2390003 [Candidatus Desulfosporosinus infrequens]|uniref:Uncharacterized protein n=1 Tax=Candidatus Desulfosporosinus infrequens TaxID=2043169 RepID=A0A2U3KNB5_9FIRM|nr:hypothetical protein SBF1_2390003 [Candidatus Desulfosporosinus infrequens]
MWFAIVKAANSDYNILPPLLGGYIKPFPLTSSLRQMMGDFLLKLFFEFSSNGSLGCEFGGTVEFLVNIYAANIYSHISTKPYHLMRCIGM